MEILTALGTAVVGGLIVLLGQWLSRRHRVRQENQTRWLADRRAMYASFLRAMNDVHSRAGPPATQDDRAPYDAAHRDLLQAWGELQLLAPPRLMRFADAIRDWSIDMGITLEQHLDRAREADWDTMREAYWVLRRDLIDECRRDLSIPLAETLEHVQARDYSLPVYHPDAR